MKSLNTIISSLLMAFCSSLLALLGFSSCTNNELMYGMPPAESFEIKGSVTDEQRQPVKDAEIRVTAPEVDFDAYAITTTTNQIGHYNISFLYLYYPEFKVVCIPKETNLEPDSVTITMDRNLEDVNFILKAKHSEAD